MDIIRASKRLSELDLKISLDNIFIEVLWFRVMKNTGSWRINRHTHSAYEFHFVRSGACHVVLDDREFIAGEGEFYLTSPGIYHEQNACGELEYVEYCINCDIKVTDDTPSEAGNIVKVLTQTPCKNYKDLYGSMRSFDLALKEADNQQMGYYNSIRNLASMIILSAARSLNGDKPLFYDVPVKSRKHDYRFEQIKKFIEDNVYSLTTTGDVAKFMHLSEKQVCRIVEEKKGVSTKEFIIQLKFNKSKELLKDKNISIKEIADKLGFSSEYYFSQFFKRMDGYPPATYRKNL